MLGTTPSSLARADTEAWPLHVKDVPTLSLDALSALDTTDKSRIRWKHARGWLDDPTFYAAVPRCSARGTPSASLKREFVQQLVSHGIVEKTASADVRGWTKMFGVEEPAKLRIRPIKHTFIVNDALDKETLMPCHYPTKAEITQLVHKGSYFIAFDFAAWFDQFEYAPEIRDLFCFRQQGEYFRLRKLAMGQRQAPEVASAATDVLRDFPDAKAHSEALIDNVIFVGTRRAVLHDAHEFVKRVKAIGAKLNDDNIKVADLLSRTGDWCGISLDCVNKTVCLNTKTVTKTAFSWSQRSKWTWRGFAAHVGLLFWSWGILDIPMDEYFPLLRFISHVGKLMTDRPEDWDEPAMVWPSAWPVLQAWTDLVLSNRPRVVPRQAAADWLICTDASRWGWGYVALHSVTGEVRVHGERWTPQMIAQNGAKLGRSVFTEPQAIVHALGHLLRCTDIGPTHVRIGTDNAAAKASFNRGFNSHSYDINACLSRVRRMFVGTPYTFEFIYIPGSQNPADAPSRGHTVKESSAELASCLKQMLGSGTLAKQQRVSFSNEEQLRPLVTN